MSTFDTILATVRNSVNYDTKVDATLSVAYPEYVAEHSITEKAHVSAHVKAFKEAAYPGVKSSDKADKASREYKAHTFSCRIRNGLNAAAGLKAKPSEALITPKGAASSLEAVIAAWEAAQA